ncbi:MAG: hypothetical protein JSR66_03110 [Proteobacteria bacterium]|nr:hypothetical protein [Pseudomonadota bacterium]
MGRPKGVPNKFSAEAKECLALAFEGLGGVEGLVEWGKKHRAAFYRIWSKLIANSGASAAVDASMHLTANVNIGGVSSDAPAGDLTHEQLMSLGYDELTRLALAGRMGADQILDAIAAKDAERVIEHEGGAEPVHPAIAAPGAPVAVSRVVDVGSVVDAVLNVETVPSGAPNHG